MNELHADDFSATPNNMTNSTFVASLGESKFETIRYAGRDGRDDLGPVFRNVHNLAFLIWVTMAPRRTVSQGIARVF
jgi:hypothetical protein